MKRALPALALAVAALTPAAAHAGQPSPVRVVPVNDDNHAGAGVFVNDQPGAGVFVDKHSGEVCAGIGTGIPFCTPGVG
jgi:hypothetical protein